MGDVCACSGETVLRCKAADICDCFDYPEPEQPALDAEALALQREAEGFADTVRDVESGLERGMLTEHQAVAHVLAAMGMTPEQVRATMAGGIHWRPISAARRAETDAVLAKLLEHDVNMPAPDGPPF